MPNHSDAILHLLSHLYALRSASLWKPKSRSSWFAKTVSSLENSLPPSAFQAPTTPAAPSPSLLHTLFARADLAYGVYRHVIVLEPATRAGRLFGFLPPQLLTAKQLACDPVPPPTAVSEYDPRFFEGAEDPLALPRGRREQERMLERMVPDPVFRRQLQVRPAPHVALFTGCCAYDGVVQDFFQANPQFAERFPGGIVQFAQVAAQMPEEVLEDLMIGIAAGGDAGLGGMELPGGGMPGQMPGMARLEDEDDVPDLPPPQEDGEDGEEEEEEDEEIDVAVRGGSLCRVWVRLMGCVVQPLPVRLLRNVMNRLWGGGNQEETDGALRDEAGVD